MAVQNDVKFSTKRQGMNITTVLTLKSPGFKAEVDATVLSGD